MLCRLTEDVTDTKISNLDLDGTFTSYRMFGPAEDVGGLQVVVADGRMLTVEE